MNLLLRIAATAVAVWVTAWLVPGIQVGATAATESPSANTVITLLLVSAIIGLVNAIVKPVAQVLTGCLILLTFGLFLLVVNAAMLMVSAWICAQVGVPFTVDGWGAAFLGSIIISFVSALINGITGAGHQTGNPA